MKQTENSANGRCKCVVKLVLCLILSMKIPTFRLGSGARHLREGGATKRTTTYRVQTLFSSGVFKFEKERTQPVPLLLYTYSVPAISYSSIGR